jgi:dTDP-glucose pyrophosphorylase
MDNNLKYTIGEDSTIRNGLERIDTIGENNAVLFVISANQKLIGTVTDGDIRRGLIKNANLEDPLSSIANQSFRKIVDGEVEFEYIQECKSKGIFILPNVTAEGFFLGCIDINKYKTSLPLHVVLMAGGKGERLMPLTKTTPKPMLHIGQKPIIEHNIDRLISFGIKHFSISINYLGNVISDYFKDGSEKGVHIDYLKESKPLGTLGSLSLAKGFSQDHILVMNSDLLTNIDFEDFYKMFLAEEAEMAVATVPYHIDLPYAVMEIDGNKVLSFKEKPRYTYFANAGIYIINKTQLELIPHNKFYNATDLMDVSIRNNKRLVNYPIYGYWLDIGGHETFKKAQQDVKHLEF